MSNPIDYTDALRYRLHRLSDGKLLDPHPSADLLRAFLLTGNTGYVSAGNACYISVARRMEDGSPIGPWEPILNGERLAFEKSGFEVCTAYLAEKVPR